MLKLTVRKRTIIQGETPLTGWAILAYTKHGTLSIGLGWSDRLFPTRAQARAYLHSLLNPTL